MSRGYGHVERAILELLRRQRRNEYGVWSGREFRGLTEDVYRVTPATEAQLASARRAVRTLKAAGLVHTWRDRTRLLAEVPCRDGVTRELPESYVQSRHGRLWAVTKSVTWVSLAPDPTPEERAAADAEYARLVSQFR